MTARIHPGESNSSFVVQGFLQFVCSNDPLAKEIRNKYIFYVIPMANPDGVVAGNYRTSLFGKDLNRTFDQMRKFAFPEIYYLLRFA
jgi:murein tripeptide amidase MpaA